MTPFLRNNSCRTSCTKNTVISYLSNIFSPLSLTNSWMEQFLGSLFCPYICTNYTGTRYQYSLPISRDNLPKDPICRLCPFSLSCTLYNGSAYLGNINCPFSRNNCNVFLFLGNISSPLCCNNYTWAIYLGNVNCCQWSSAVCYNF